jgi:xanthine/CO dehydrogenase XdhC/CoxF family maturation factor
MSEALEVLKAIQQADRSGRGALATIVSVKGSTYRRPGARLFVPESGHSVGNLSGGCLEGEVEGLAHTVMEDEQPRLTHYDLTADDEVVWGWGLGCNGAIEVLVEPVRRAREVARLLSEAIEHDRALVVATSLPGSRGSGARVAVFEDGSAWGGLGDPATDAEAVAKGLELLGLGESRVLEIGSDRIFFEVVKPPLRLLVCGAGHDAIPLVEEAARLGWRIAVADDRSDMLSWERFPGARELVETEPAEVAGTAGVDPNTYAVVMSHNFLRDRDYLRSLASSPAAYIGMLGPRKRLERLLDELARAGVTLDPGRLERVHGPAGLDLGAEGPEQVALAIVAEILSVSNGRAGGHLRDRPGPIHERATEAAP